VLWFRLASVGVGRWSDLSPVRRRQAAQLRARADQHTMRDEFADAARLYKKAHKLSPAIREPEVAHNVYNNWGWALKGVDPREAIRMHRRAIKALPKASCLGIARTRGALTRAFF
jgi:tetratricopeptide (TPR) repeat protein